MADISLPFGGDLTVDDTGDIAGVDGTDELVQRVVRRFLSNTYLPAGYNTPPSPPDYVYDKTYGGNVRRYVDRNLSTGILQNIQTGLLACLQAEVEVSKTTPPSIQTYYAGGTVYVQATCYLAGGTVLAIPATAVK